MSSISPEFDRAARLWRKTCEYLEKEFNIGDARSEFAVIDCWQDEIDMVHFRLQQIYQKLRLVNQVIIVHIGSDDEIRNYTGNYRHIVNIDLNAKISAEQAIEIVRREVKSESDDVKTEQAIYPDQNSEKNFFAYEIVLPIWQQDRPMNMICYVDAKDGEVLASNSTIGRAGLAQQPTEIAEQLNRVS